MKKTKFIIVLLSLLLGFTQWAGAQNSVVKGKVIDASGEAIIGANVSQKGVSSVGAITDADGNFTLNVPGNATLVVAYLGYVSQEVKVNNQSSLVVQLLEDVQALAEVVVTGYGGVQKKIESTGSISAMTNKQLTITKNENVVNMLAGKMPGVRITQRTSQPGEFNSLIDVRGFGEPLFVVDGVSQDKAYISRMDPEEIENISLLKDASAAIYGIRASNGVMLITTKRGTAKNGKVDVTYSGTLSFQQMMFIPDSYNQYQWMYLRNEQQYRDFNMMYFAGKPAMHTDDELQAALTAKNYDWQKRIFRTVTPQTQHNLVIDGGSESLRYFFNLGYGRQDGCYQSGSVWAENYNLRSTVDAKIIKGLTLSATLSAIFNTKNNLGNMWDDYKVAFLIYPGTPFYANDNPLYLNGYTRWSSEFTNLIGKTDENYKGYTRNNDRRLSGRANINYEVPNVKGLTLTGFYDYFLNIPDQTQYSKKYNTYAYDPVKDTYTVAKVEGGAFSTIQRQMWLATRTTMNLGAAYKNSFGQHSIDATGVLEEVYDSWGTGFYAQRNLTINSQAMSLGESDGQQGGGDSPAERAQRAFIGKFNYNFADKYLLSLSARYEGSSRWPKQSRWGFFPGVAAAWRVSEENFIKHKFDFVSNLKLRASYGKMASDTGVASDYPDIYTGYNLNNNQFGWIFTPGSGQTSSTAIRGTQPNAIPNFSKTWIQVTMQNIALDFGFLKDKISGSFDIFQRDRTGIMGDNNAVIPGTVGAKLPQININADRNYGWELELTYRGRGHDYDYFFGGQFSSTRRTNRFLQETAASNSFDNWRNRYAYRFWQNDMWWSRKMEGMFTSTQQIRSFTIYPMNQDALPGDWWQQDWNGDGIVDDSDQYPLATKGLPWMNYGFTLGGSYKNFDLIAAFQGSLGVYTQLSEVFVEALPFGGQNSVNWFWDRWHPVDPKADYWNPNTQWISGYYPLTGGSSMRDYSNGIMNASYLRMKSLEIGYNFPKKTLTKLRMKNLRLFVNGYNLLTFTPLRNVDPERPSVTQYANGSNGGADQMYMYPNDKTYTVGLKVTF